MKSLLRRIPKMKKLLKITSLILALCAVSTLFTGCISSIIGFIGDGNRKGPAMWVVEDKEGNRAYLFGSIHIGTADMYPFCEEVEDAFALCDVLAVEYDIIKTEKESQSWTEEEMSAYLSQFLIPDGKKINDIISNDVYLAAKSYLTSRGIYSETMDYLVPAYWSSVISQEIIAEAGYSSSHGVDRYFINKAYDAGIPVFDVENEKDQLQLLLSEPVAVTEANIEAMVSSVDALIGPKYTYGVILEVFNRGDMASMEMLMSTDVPEGMFDEETTKAYEEFNKRMNDERNILMAEAVKSFLANGETVFFVVGAAHMLGDAGIVTLLTAEGYTVYRK